VKRQYFVALEVSVSLLVVCGLFWVAFFLKPVVHVDKIERFPFERRDAFYGITSLDDEGQSVCAVGSYGKVVRTDDGGVTWLIQETPTLNHLQNVVAWDHEALLAIGDKNTVLVTLDAGQNWRQMEVPSFPFGGQLLGSRIDRQSGRAWVVGSMGTVLVSDDRGESWSMTHPEEDVSWNDVFVTEGQVVWIVGEFGKVRYSKDNGQTWNPATVPTETSLNAIVFSDNDHGVIVGLTGTILTTTDGGKNWRLAESAIETHLYAVLWDGSTYSAVGDAGVLLMGDAQGAGWKPGKLAPHNFGWYTAMTMVRDVYFISGADVGVYAHGKWLPFAPGLRDYRKGSVNDG
jgi:photosystem II stability/assembly factor-like uncharacterized protein